MDATSHRITDTPPLSDDNIFGGEEEEKKGKLAIIESVYLKTSRPRNTEEEDDLHDAILRVLRRRKTPINFQHGASMIALAKREATRQRRRSKSLEQIMDMDTVSSFELGIDEQAEMAKIRAAVANLLDIGVVVVGRFWGGLSRREVAAMMGISVLKVQRCERVALKSLQRSLQGLAPEHYAVQRHTNEDAA